MPSRKSGKSEGRQIARYAGDFLLGWIPGCEKGVSYVPQVSLHIVTIMFTSIQTFPRIWQLWSRYGGENLWVMPGPFTALLWQEGLLLRSAKGCGSNLIQPLASVSICLPEEVSIEDRWKELSAADTRGGSVIWERFCEQSFRDIMSELQEMHVDTL